MSYLKGGSVVDGNLYVEGDLKIKGSSVGEEGLEYAYVITPTDTFIPILTPGSGELKNSFFVQSSEDIEERDVEKSYAVLSLSQKNYLKFNVNASGVIFNYQSPLGTHSKTCLYGFDKNDDIISEGISTDNAYMPITEPAFWRYDDVETYPTSLSFVNNVPVYTMPDAEESEIDVGETVLITGDSPVQP